MFFLLGVSSLAMYYSAFQKVGCQAAYLLTRLLKWCPVGCRIAPTPALTILSFLFVIWSACNWLYCDLRAERIDETNVYFKAPLAMTVSASLCKIIIY